MYTRAYWEQTTQLQQCFRNRIRRCTSLHQIRNEVLTEIFDVLSCWPPRVAKGAGVLIHSLNTKVTFFLEIFWASLDWGYSLPKQLVVSANKLFLTRASYSMADNFLLPISLQMRKNKTRMSVRTQNHVLPVFSRFPLSLTLTQHKAAKLKEGDKGHVHPNELCQ